jgi:hypothetical protein
MFLQLFNRLDNQGLFLGEWLVGIHRRIIISIQIYRKRGKGRENRTISLKSMEIRWIIGKSYMFHRIFLMLEGVK